MRIRVELGPSKSLYAVKRGASVVFATFALGASGDSVPAAAAAAAVAVVAVVGRGLFAFGCCCCCCCSMIKVVEYFKKTE